MSQAKVATVRALPVTAAGDANGPGEVRVCTVIICDDQPELRDAIRLTLSMTPRFSVIADACDAVSCLDRVRDNEPDLLILDVNMPGGGPQVVTAVKRIRPSLHIVVFSGLADRAIESAMLAAGADQYVLKTGRVRPLLQAMDEAYQQFTCPAPARDIRNNPQAQLPDQGEHLPDADGEVEPREEPERR